MTALTLDIDQTVYERLQQEADRTGQPVEAVAETWLAQRAAPINTVLSPAPSGERERAIEVLRAAGLLAEPSPEMLALAAQSTATLEEVSAALSRGGGKPLSEIILEQRGPKE